jgi:septal ring factor EnvC (AmiA/AmiB activator)
LTEKEFLSTLATIRAELAATRQHHERQTEALAAIREDLAREREAARRREEELTARLAALQEELRRPWWKRLLRGKR